MNVLMDKLHTKKANVLGLGLVLIGAILDHYVRLNKVPPELVHTTIAFGLALTVLGKSLLPANGSEEKKDEPKDGGTQ